MKFAGGAWETVKATVHDWNEDNGSRLSAALAYYTLLSLAPLLVITVTVIGFFFGPEAARGKLSGELSALVGAQPANGIQAIIAHARSPSRGTISTIVGVVTLFLGASGVFGELQSALDAIWEVKPKPGRGVIGMLKARFLSFTMVLGVAFLLLVSLVLSAFLSALGSAFAHALPGGESFWQAVNLAFSFVMVTGLFALIFKYVPDAVVEWKDVWVGAAVTAALFTLGKFLLGIYLGKTALASSYGAAGSLVALVVWVYYATQILFLGAEFTQVQARQRGRAIRPDQGAVRERQEAPSKEQMPARARRA